MKKEKLRKEKTKKEKNKNAHWFFFAFIKNLREL
jgi:hypothetical protein